MRAREMGVPQVRSFYTSRKFSSTGCMYDANSKTIVKKLIDN